MKVKQISKFMLPAVALTLSLFATATQAAQVVDILSGPTFVRGSWANFGYQFSVSEPVRVSALGLFDYQGNGLAESHPVGIWNEAGTLLAQVLVDNGSAVVVAANQGHAWRYTDIAPLDLAPGNYKLGAFYATTADPFVGSSPEWTANIIYAPQVTFGGSFVTTGGTEFFTEPNTPTSFNPGFFGPNAMFSPVPEPGTLACLLVGGLMLARRRR